jgi:hypothetical protein
MRRTIHLFAAAAVFVLAEHPVCAQDSDIREVQVQFPNDATGATIVNCITGDEVVDYSQHLIPIRCVAVGSRRGAGRTLNLEARN